VSRPLDDVLTEIAELAAQGVREVTLLGQNVNAYHGADADGAAVGLGALVRRLARIEGLARVRYTTSHPRDVDEALIAAHALEPKLMPFLHLPVQAGSDRVLAAMNRGHTADDYLRIVARLRAARPDLALSSDFIVGFPGESEADFEATLDLVREVGFASAFSFKYSARPGTPAAALDGQVPQDVKEARLERLQALLREQQDAFHRSLVGTVQPILIDGAGRKPGQLLGRSPYLQPVHLPAPDGGEAAAWRGRIVAARIEAALPNSLAAVAVDSVQAREPARMPA
jgi:tRNA-2-methylthio-N6-dimethylallyladenosine synthase